MTNKEAIRILGLECDEWDISHCTASERREAFEMAITALDQLDNNSTIPDNSTQFNGIESKVKGLTACRVPEVAKDTNVPSTDFISRQVAIDELDKGAWGVEWDKVLAKAMLENLPSVQPETCDTCKHGYFGDEQCSSCRVRFTSHYERRTDER